MENIISVTKNKCKQCYSCIRNCPVKAVQINNGQAEILSYKCINCGKCIKSCPQNAKVVLDSIDETLELLKGNNKVIACIAPSFVISFYPYPYKKVLGALKSLGFSEVWEVAKGAEALTEKIGKYINENKMKTYLSSACPAIVSMIEKHYPELIKFLLPFVSPMIATAKIIKNKFRNEDIKIVFIGPCVAKKAEAMNFEHKNLVNSVLTFDEIKELFKREKIDINYVGESEFDSQYCSTGKLFPLSGGLLRNLTVLGEIDDAQYINVEEDKDTIKIFKALRKGRYPFKFVDLLMCKGCIEGCKVDSNLSYYEKINIIYDYYKASKSNKKPCNIDLDFTTKYKNRRNILPMPSDDAVQEVLNMTNKFTVEDELNCGACGYATCRDKAIAVVQGIAEVDMCLPYLIAKKNNLLEELSKNLNEITILKDELETIIESSYDGLVITDGSGKILKSNNSFKKMLGETVVEDVHKMEIKKMLYPSLTLLALKEKRRISFIQSSKEGKKYLSTATPIFNNKGQITRVVSNIRDIDELNRLRNQLNETRKLEKYHMLNNNENEKYETNEDNIVANSKEFGKVLEVASNVATVDSTILILGESGVGKEVLVKFIHNLSNRRNKPVIKINCGAIPVNLIESELFGYDAGAFTGAQKKGKPGLIELAHEGTLFLDEIGELPLNVQVKFLRFIQERRFMRIGGTCEKEVDVRIIASTNRELLDMVNKGLFRADLYYRLNVVPIEIPPLRKRPSDILPLCYHFLQIFNTKYKCDKDLTLSTEKILFNYNWPGNVRELENVIERLVVTTKGDIIDQSKLPLFLFESYDNMDDDIKISGIIPLKKATEMVEKKLISEAYKKYKTTYEIAKALEVNQSTVVRKIQKHLHFNALKHD